MIHLSKGVNCNTRFDDHSYYNIHHPQKHIVVLNNITKVNNLHARSKNIEMRTRYPTILGFQNSVSNSDMKGYGKLFGCKICFR